MEDLRMPALMSGWEFVEELGEGSYGIVYSIRRGDEFCALKVISFPKDESELKLHMKEMKDEDTLNEYFHSKAEECLEIEALQKKLQYCENVVRIFDTAIEPKAEGIGWNVFIRMEMLTELREYQDFHDMKERDVISMALQLCNALKACEKENILHRDIKPENILVNEKGIFKLGDFGLARRRETSVGSFSIKGTFDYMSPEVYHGNRYGKRADLYSAGMLLYRMLNRNRGPFIPLDKQIVTYRDKEDALEKRMKGDIIPEPAEASPEMANIIQRFCWYDEKYRFADASEAEKALLQLQKGKYRIVDLKNLNEKDENKKNGEGKGKTRRIIIISAAIIIIAAAAVFGLSQGYVNNIATNAGIGAEYVFQDYEFGKGLTCSLDDNGLLTIKGSGSMADTSKERRDDPDNGLKGFAWDDYSNDVKEIHFEADSSILVNSFDGLKNLTKVEISGEVDRIGTTAFANCISLEEVKLPESVEIIDNSAFIGCTKLEKINVPEGTEIGESVFKRTAYLENTMNRNNGFGIINDVLYEYNGHDKKVIIPDGVRVIGSAAFFGNSDIESVIIPESVEDIRSGAFMSCVSLSEVVIENSNCKISPDSFSNTAWGNGVRY